MNFLLDLLVLTICGIAVQLMPNTVWNHMLDIHYLFGFVVGTYFTMWRAWRVRIREGI